MDRLLIKHSLLDRGLSLADLARQTGLTYDRVIRIVNGYRQPKPEEIQAIADVLDISVQAVGGRHEESC